MNFEKSIYSGKTRITYYDLDQNGQIKFSALLRMVHIAADVNANDLGVGFKVLSGLNMSFVIQRFGARVLRMPKYNEMVTVRTWPYSLARGTFLRQGDMYDEKGNKIMEWSSLWILFDIAERKILKPSALPITLDAAADQGVMIQPQKISLDTSEMEDDFTFHTHTVRYAEVDTNMHMNNSIYGDLITNALGEIPPWKELQINYLGEAKLSEDVEVNSQRKDNIYLVKGRRIPNYGKIKVSFAAQILI
ncbi:MAG: thioesterase [Defluviitaleaceae bacterium]|nr:thioesterase [Defluviitaleaceae bacterium]